MTSGAFQLTDSGELGHEEAVGSSSSSLAMPLGRASAVPAPPPPSFEKVYEAHFDFVWRSARRLGVSEAAVDDVVQDVFIVVHRRLGEFEGRSSLKTWVFGILLRVVSDHRRTLRRKGGLAPLPDEDVLHGGSEGPAEALEKQQAARLVHALLEELDDDKRTVFVLAELEELPAPEIAEMLAVPVNTVYSRLRAARDAFEKALARHRAREAGEGARARAKERT